MKKQLLIAAFFLFAATLFVPVMTSASSLPAPTLLAPAAGESFSDRQPAIRGVTKNDTQVAVYIDDVFNGYAQVQNGPEGTASFVYFPYVDLVSGYHSVKVRAENAETGVRSDVSGDVSFYIDYPYPAPQIHYAAVNQDTTWSKPFLAGVAKNDSRVQVFIDGVLNGEFLVMNSGTGTASFSYQPFLPLSEGDHTAYAVAIAPDGRQSVSSETLTFSVSQPEVAFSESIVAVSQPTAPEAVSEESAAVEEEPVVEEESEEVASEPEESEAVSEEETVSAESKDSEEQASEEEPKEEEGKSKSSTIGWVLLILIAAALVWRNRKSFSQMKGGRPDDFAKKVDEDNSSSVEVVDGKSDQKSDPAMAGKEDESSNQDNQNNKLS